jgi:hypothetical protein
LRDRVENPFTHLGGLEVENLAERMREGVPQKRNTLGRMPYSPSSTLVTREEDWGRRRRSEWRKREIERRQQFRGLNSPGPAPGQTLSGLTGDCSRQPVVVQLSWTLSERKQQTWKFFKN